MQEEQHAVWLAKWLAWRVWYMKQQYCQMWFLPLGLVARLSILTVKYEVRDTINLLA